jgi:hypothetical protein
MGASIFEQIDEGLYLPTEAALGPWSDQGLHGGPPAMLLAREIERFPSGQEMFTTRLTVELMRPVGRVPLGTKCRLVRPGRKVRLVEASLWNGEQEVARATALLIRRAPVDVPQSPSPPPHPLTESLSTWSGSYRSGPAYHVLGVEIRTFPESRNEDAPCWAWVRLRLPLVPGEQPGGLVRACAAADFPNGISYVVHPQQTSFVNPDVTLYLHRLPLDEWVLVDARTWLGPYGSGVAEAELYDREGRIGRSVQGLIVQPQA